VGQNIQAKASDERAIATYDDAGAILEETKQIQEHLKAQDATISDLTAQLKKLSK
jgi:prefoldin subunit 5